MDGAGEEDPSRKKDTMALRINQNIAAQNAYRNLSVNDGQMSKSLEKLSSGFRINRAADDAAGLAISEGLRSQVGGLKAATRNAQDGVSVVQTAEGALTEVHSILQRARDLQVQASNGSNNQTSLDGINTELNSLADEITAIGTRTDFNGVKLLDGAANLKFQVGANSGDTLAVDLSGVKLADAAQALKDAATANVGGLGDTTQIDKINTQITAISKSRSDMGASQNRLEHTINSLSVAVENLSASESRIRDTDMAQEMVSFTKNQILSQAGTAMLAQANQAPQGVLQLLR
jgi:flagellin